MSGTQQTINLISTVGAVFGGLAWLFTFGWATYLAIEDDEIRWPYIWSVLTGIISTLSIVGLVATS